MQGPELRCAHIQQLMQLCQPLNCKPWGESLERYNRAHVHKPMLCHPHACCTQILTNTHTNKHQLNLTHTHTYTHIHTQAAHLQEASQKQDLRVKQAERDGHRHLRWPWDGAQQLDGRASAVGQRVDDVSKGGLVARKGCVGDCGLGQLRRDGQRWERWG